jgi:uncharacterized protein Smg (DUF494 family)
MEELIQRAALALEIRVSEGEIVSNLQKSGYSNEDIYLAIEAAKQLNKERESHNDNAKNS